MLDDGFYELGTVKGGGCGEQKAFMHNRFDHWVMGSCSVYSTVTNGGWEQGNLTWVKEAFQNTWSVFCCTLLVKRGLWRTKWSSEIFLFSFPFVSCSLQLYSLHTVFHSEVFDRDVYTSVWKNKNSTVLKKKKYL